MSFVSQLFASFLIANLALPAALFGVLLQAAGQSAKPEAKSSARVTPSSSPLSEQEKVEHLLDRLTFGPTPGEVARVQAMGVNAWIDQQLHPEKLDDSALEARLNALPAMRLSTAKMLADFPPPPVIRQIEAGKMGVPHDRVEQAIYANQLAEYRAKRTKDAQDAKDAATNGAANGAANADGGMQDQQSQPAAMAAGNADAAANQDTGSPGSGNPGSGNPGTATQEAATQGTADAGQAADSNTGQAADRRNFRDQTQRLLQMPPANRVDALLAVTPGSVRPLLQHMKGLERIQLVDGMTPEQQQTVIALGSPVRVVAGEMMQQKLLRDIYSSRQLQEVMTDFWLNHFNVYVKKNGYTAWLIATYERDVIRPHALGKFEDLLDAVAKSPAMQVYLDNAESIGPNSQAAQRAQFDSKNKAARGLNENYARELMELHTLGVNGGYTQRDVTEVAKVFTGWTVDPRNGYEFAYMPRRHQPGTKVVLGQTIAEKGQSEGFEVLHILATNPATANFISTKLATRFVGDTPPPALVHAMAQKYLATKGDIREVLRTMLSSPEFWSRQAYRDKVKTPLEFVASAARATDANVGNATVLVASLDRLGMPLYGCQPPTGYSMKADVWVSSSSLINRMNFALALTANKLPGVSVDVASLAGTQAEESAAQKERKLEAVLLDGKAAEQTRATVLKEMADPNAAAKADATTVASIEDSSVSDEAVMGADHSNAKKNGKRAGQRDLFTAVAANVPRTPVSDRETATAAGLLLGSPDFQRR